MERKFTDDYVQYPRPEEDGIDEFCRKCHPAARRMFTNLTTARDNGSRDLTEIGERLLRLVDPDYPRDEYHPDVEAAEAVERLCQELGQLRTLRDRTRLELRERVLAGVLRQVADVPVTDAQAAGDAVLAPADRYLTWLLHTPGCAR